jgi:hypothetical protein
MVDTLPHNFREARFWQINGRWATSPFLDSFRFADQPGTKVTDGSEPLMFPQSMAELSDD